MSERESPEYDAITIPEGKSRHDYSYVERRAEILKRIERRGHPSAFNKSKLAREYDVSHTSIGRDFDALAEYVASNLDRDHEFIMDRVMRGALVNLVEDGDHYKAAKVAEKWFDWLADAGVVVREPDRKEVDMAATVAREQTETTDYVLEVTEE